MTTPVRLAVGAAYSDRVAPVADGSVADCSIDISVEFGTAREVFRRGLHGDEFDLLEMSLAAHCLLSASGDRRFVGLPLFTSRMFRHGSIYVRPDGPVVPQDLNGRRIGLVDFQMTSAVWMRGILAEHHGVDLDTIDWFVGGEGLAARAALTRAASGQQRIRSVPATTTLSRMLLNGEIDALMATSMPLAYADGSGRLRRLFVDAQDAERRYYSKTGIFPIMHLCVLRRKRFDEDPTIAGRVCQLFEAAKSLSAARIGETDSLTVMSPWLTYGVEEAIGLLGRDYWPYGVENNRHCLEVFLSYLHAQGLVERPLGLSDIFVAD